MHSNPTDKGYADPFIRLDFVDSLRFFAILYVIICHLMVIPHPYLAVPEWIRPFIFNGGDAGVCLFFVLSAFSLSYSMDTRKGETNSTRRFYTRRFFRIAPLFYLMMLIYWIRDAAVFGFLHPVSEVLVNALLIFNLIPSCITGYVWASWTIGVIVWLYLLFPLIHKRVRNLTAALILLAASILIARGWSIFVIHYGEATGYLSADQTAYVWNFGFLQNLPVFVCGVVAYRLFFDYLVKMTPKAQRRTGLVLIISFVFFYTALLTEYIQNIFWGQHILHGICFSFLILALGLRPFSFLVNTKTVLLGKASYSLYLIHPIIIFTFAPLYYLCYASIPAYIPAYMVSLLITLIPLIILSLVCYKYIELPGVALGKIFISGK
jgi:peptidoglycan/LPS O-acetylase OafA/YrhL